MYSAFFLAPHTERTFQLGYYDNGYSSVPKWIHWNNRRTYNRNA